MTDSPRPPIRPVTLEAARGFVAEVHRHNDPPVGWLFGTSLWDDEMRGVAIAGRPCRALQDGFTVEITRVATDGIRNGNSMLYSRLWRAARALGYLKAVTYTLASESGASLRACGFVPVAELDARSPEGWANRPGRYETNLFGEPGRGGSEPRIRWEAGA